MNFKTKKISFVVNDKEFEKKFNELKLRTTKVADNVVKAIEYGIDNVIESLPATPVKSKCHSTKQVVIDADNISDNLYKNIEKTLELARLVGISRNDTYLNITKIGVKAYHNVLMKTFLQQQKKKTDDVFFKFKLD